MDFGCAAYCKYAEQCLGTLPEEFVAQQEDLLKDRVAVKMKQYFGTDFKRIGHAGRVARYAEKIGKSEKADMAVVLCAAYLHDIGIKNAEEKYGSAEARHQHVEGPPVARKILEDLGAREALIQEVCDIISHHHHPKDSETLNFKVLYDADMLANMEDCRGKEQIGAGTLAQKIDRLYLTDAGKKLAGQMLIQQG
jgi:HD superfamily phosphodiesterase